MRKEDFDKLRKEVFDLCEDIYQKKNHDYTNGDDDVLKFIREMSKKTHTNEYVALNFMLQKQLAAIDTIFKYKGEVEESEPLEERISDVINYLMLLKALVNETRDKNDD